MFPGMYKSNNALQSQSPYVCDDNTHCYSTLLLARLFAMTTQRLNVRNHVGYVSCNGDVQAFMQEKEDACATVVLLSVSGGLVAAFAILDCVRAEASGVVSALQKMGVTVYMVTGEAQVCFCNSFNCCPAQHSIQQASQRLGKGWVFWQPTVRSLKLVLWRGQ